MLSIHCGCSTSSFFIRSYKSCTSHDLEKCRRGKVGKLRGVKHFSCFLRSPKPMERAPNLCLLRFVLILSVGTGYSLQHHQAPSATTAVGDQEFQVDYCGSVSVALLDAFASLPRKAHALEGSGAAVRQTRMDDKLHRCKHHFKGQHAPRKAICPIKTEVRYAHGTMSLLS